MVNTERYIYTHGHFLNIDGTYIYIYSTNLHAGTYILYHEGPGAGVGVPRAAETDQPAAASRQNPRLTQDSWN